MYDLQLRWGILGAGNVAHDFATALRTLPATEHKLAAVASRSLQRAQEFASLHGFTRYHGSYAELLQDNEVDVIYVAAVNSAHKDIVLQALDHGKHVLCEKPMGVNATEVEEMIRFARQRKLFLMEGIWSFFVPSWIEIMSQIKSGAIGRPRFLNFMHARKVYQKREKFYSRHLGGGMLTSLGQYPLAFANMIFNEDEPKKIIAAGENFDTGVDKSHHVTISFANGKIATSTISCDYDDLENAEIIGEKGKIKLNAPFWCPTRVITPKAVLDFEMPVADMPLKFTNSSGFSYEAKHVRQCILSGWLESNVVTHETTMKLARWMDEIRRQLGVIYEQDEIIAAR